MNDSHSIGKKMLRKRDLLIKRENCWLDANDLVEEIQNCERAIQILDDQESEDKRHVFRTYMSLLNPVFTMRSKIIESIPKFWATVLEYHPKLTHLITEEVAKVLQYVKELDVENTDTTYFKITMVFEENPYIENNVLTKEFTSSRDEEFVSVTSPIKWKTAPNQEKSVLETVGRKRKSESTSFFTWFCNDDITDNSFILQCFSEIWQNPLPTFLLGIMDNEVEDFGDLGDLCVNTGTNDDEDNIIDSSSETMDDDDGWIGDVEDETETEEEESDLEEEEEERDEEMDEDIGEEA